jgi:hypothetical protein
MLYLMFAKVYNCLRCFHKFIWYFTKNIVVKPSIWPDTYPVSGPYRISGIRPLPDIRYPVFLLAGYTAGRISGKNSIRCIPIENYGNLWQNWTLVEKLPGMHGNFYDSDIHFAKPESYKGVRNKFSNRWGDNKKWSKFLMIKYVFEPG